MSSRPSQSVPPMLTRHLARDRRLGRVVVVAGRTTVADRELRELGFTARRISGKKADGGPGCRVPQVFVVPVARWDSDELLRVRTLLVLAKNNPGTALSELADLAARAAELKNGRAAQT